MNISPISFRSYSSNAHFKNNSIMPIKTSFKGVIQGLPDPRDYADASNFCIPWQKQDELKNEYKSKVLAACFDKDGNLNPQIVEYLDNTKFNIETDVRGEKQNMTVKEAINSSINGVDDVSLSLYHATFGTETIEQIRQNGFNPEKISRTKLGPGFYFSPSEGGAREYSSAVLMADCTGKCARMKQSFFEKIMESGIVTKLSNFIGLNSRDYATGMAESEVSTRIINEYARNYLVNDLGIDMAYGSTGRFESCFAVFNPDSILNIRSVN